MAIIVQKYGGSSVSDIARLQSVAEAIVARKRAGDDLVVVVSAMGDTTDELLERARAISAEPSRRELDMLLSVGERISMTLLSMAIHHHGVEAISLTGSQCGIITTHDHARARIIDVRPFRVQDELAAGRIVIVAGYQGTSYKREVTTLGRGGSDTTAVALAAALDAEACEIYSDVDGVFSADPRVVLDAQRLESLSYEEMLEMARAGARVLNEQAVAFAQRAKIALYARRAHDPSTQGTIIRPDGFMEQAERAERGLGAVAAAHMSDALWVRAGAHADAVVDVLAAEQAVGWFWRPGSSASLLLGTENLHALEAMRASLGALGEDVMVEDVGAVSLVGQGIGGAPRFARDAHAALAAAGVTPRDVFTTPARLTFVVAREHVTDGVRCLHDAFV